MSEFKLLEGIATILGAANEVASATNTIAEISQVDRTYAKLQKKDAQINYANSVKALKSTSDRRLAEHRIKNCIEVTRFANSYNDPAENAIAQAIASKYVQKQIDADD